MTIQALLVAAALAARPAPAPAPEPRAADLRAADPRAADLRAAPGHPALGGDTRCGACHTEEGWKAVRFAHERTGFPLDGRHATVTCKACHRAGFAAPVLGACAACHRDPHAGELGVRCGGCHDATSWEGRFSAEAHRRTRFPLSGRHAFIPCEECHGNRRDRGFARRTVDCRGCHEADVRRAAAVAVDHDQMGFTGRCQACHSPWRFRDAMYPAHDDCFQISRGPHAKIRCFDCHGRPIANTAGACTTNNANCMACHACVDVSPRHAGVLGFQCANRKCYECHRFSTGAP